MSHPVSQVDDSDDEDVPLRPVAQNPKRGCGHLKHGKGYIRSAPNALDLPAFVEIEPRLPFKEGHFRGFRHFPGYLFEMSILDRVDCKPRSVLRDDFGRAFGIAEGDHIGEMGTARAHDLIMWVGKTYYEPDEFIEEVRQLGLSKAIPISKNQEPPTVVPGWTRVWCMHMNAIDGEHPGLLGYAPLGEVIYTEPEDGHVPKWAQDYEASGKMVVAQVGDEVSAKATTNHALSDYDGITLPEGDTPTGARNLRLDEAAQAAGDTAQQSAQSAVDQADITPPSSPDTTPDEPESVVPSDKPGRDVEAADGPESGDDEGGADGEQ